MTNDAAQRGGRADGACGIRSDGGNTHSGSDGCGGARRRAAGDARGVPRIACRTVGADDAAAAEGELVEVGLAEKNRARTLQSSNDLGIASCDVFA